MAKIVGGTTSTPLRQIFVTNSNGEVETITVGNQTYDGFVDYTARGEIEDLKENGTGISVTDDGEGNVVVASGGGGGGGSNITVDQEVIDGSTNPVSGGAVNAVVQTIKTTASSALTTANRAKTSAEAAELKALQAQNAVTELNTAMSAVQEWQGVVENMAAELSNGVSDAGTAATEAWDAANEALVLANKAGADSVNTSQRIDAVIIPRLDTIEGYVGDLDTALDAIIAIQKELIGVTLITFTIDGVTYQAEEGMTWGEFIDSEYNVGGRVLIQTSGDVGYSEDGYTIWNVADADWSLVSAGNAILSNHTYNLD